MCLQLARLSNFWESDDLRDHVGSTRNISHDDAVAGTTLDLQAVCECFFGAEVDKVVGCGCRSC
jgi:hypothetical protein